MQFVTLKHNAKYNFLFDWLIMVSFLVFLPSCLAFTRVVFFSAKILNICKKFVSFRVLCGDAVKWCYHFCTGIAFTPPFPGVSNHKEALQLEKRICVSGITVEVGISQVVLDAIWGTSECLHTIEMRHVFPFLLSLLLAPSRGWKSCKWCGTGCLELWLWSAYQFLDTWS